MLYLNPKEKIPLMLMKFAKHQLEQSLMIKKVCSMSWDSKQQFQNGLKMLLEKIVHKNTKNLEIS